MTMNSYSEFNKAIQYSGSSSFNNDNSNVIGIIAEASQNNYSVFPGFVDVHVHLREPGFFYKETIHTGTLAAARGGYTTVFSMPNLNPVPDSLQNLKPQLDLIRNTAVINVVPYGSITVAQSGEKLSDMDALSPFVAGFSDDGKGVQNESIMLLAMQKAKELNKIIVAHCEDNSLLCGGYIHKGKYALEHNHSGICSESEYKQIARDIELVRQTGCAYHICHISCAQSVDIIRQAKKDGLNVTCETAPHYLLLDDSMLREEGRFKMNPPVRSKSDREALIYGVLDGTIDMIATDHAPHSAEEKSKGLKGSLMGVVGLETAFPLLYTNFVKTNVFSVDRLMDLMCFNPARRFNLNVNADCFSVWDMNYQYTVNPESFLSKGKSTPFEGFGVFGKCIKTVCNGSIAFSI